MKKLLFAALAGFVAGTAIAGEVINTELYSAVLGETKPYTIYLPDGYGTGDELVNVMVYMPEQLNDEERKIIESLQGKPDMKPSESVKNRIFSKLRHIFD